MVATGLKNMSEEARVLAEQLVGQFNERMDSFAAGIKGDFNELKMQLKDVEHKVDAITLLEERSKQQKLDLERTFSMMRSIENRVQQCELKQVSMDGVPARVSVIEQKIPNLERGTGWVDKWSLLIMGAVILALLYKVIPH